MFSGPMAQSRGQVPHGIGCAVTIVQRFRVRQVTVAVVVTVTV